MEGTTDAPVDVPRPEQQIEAIAAIPSNAPIEPSTAPSQPPMPPVAHIEPVQIPPVGIQPSLPATINSNPGPSSAHTQPAAEAPTTAPLPISAVNPTPIEDEHIPDVPPPQQHKQPTHQDPHLTSVSAAISQAAPKGRRGGGGRSGLITLKLLIDEGFIKPGEDVLSVEYKGMSHTGTLLADGRIHTVINGKSLTFDSPSAFSIYLKRLVNPSRKADDGWKTVKYDGKLLEHFKGELARQKFGGLGGGEGGSSADLEALGEHPRIKRARTSAALPFSLSTSAMTHDEPFVPDRPRRVRRAHPRFAAIGVDDEHALQPLEGYGPGEQPFTVQVSPAALAMMDYHAHLCVNEVIGMLVGTVDLEEKKIKIFRAMPVKELSTEDDSINVEMDPEDQVICMEEASKLDYKVLGGYHSHPTFPPQPSTIDIYNQVLQQHAHRVETRDGSATVEPYVAAIMSPYDHRVGGSMSSISWFYVDHVVGKVPTEGQRPDEVGCVAKELEIVQLWEPLDQLENLGTFQREMEQIAKRYAPLPERANLEGKWVDGSMRLEKMVASVQSRLPMELLGEQKVKQFASKLWVSTRAVWNVYGKAVAPPAVAPEVTAAVNSSVPQSAAVSQGGGVENGGVGGEEQEQVQGGGVRGGDEEEPISDDDDGLTQ